MIVLTTSVPNARPTTIDFTSSGGLGVLTLLPEGPAHALGAALSPTDARGLADELAAFAERHGA
jgi:hypothetical protein